MRLHQRYATLKSDCHCRPQQRHRRGATMVLAVFFIMVMLGMVGFAVDLGYIVLVRTQLQTAADSAAMSAAVVNMSGSYDDVIEMASAYAGYHAAGGKHVALNPVDVEIGVWDTNFRRFTATGWEGNAVRVVTRRDETTNGESPLFFARVFGVQSAALQAEAVAAFEDNFGGFRMPPSGESLPFLPFALDRQLIDSLMGDQGPDNWSVDPETGQIMSGPDGIPEIDFYPQDLDAPGNYGTVNIGRGNNGTAGLEQQILGGLIPEDLESSGGTLELGEDGTLVLEGDPGISAGMEDALAAIKGQPRIVPIFDQVTGAGSKAQYTIVGFAGVCIVEVELGGGDKRVMIQRTDMIIRGGIPSDGEDRQSYSIYSPVHLVR